MSRSKLIKAGLFAILAATAIIFGCQTSNTSAAKATDFNAGNIISDAVFYNKDAMTLAEIETFISSHTVACDTWGTKAVGGGRYINGVAVAASTTRAKYADMMIAAGNSRYHKPPYICLTNYYEDPTTKRTSFDSGAVKESGMLSAAEIIYKAAQTYNINPQVLLVTLKKEYSYVYTDDWPLRDQYNTVMGYACPDSGPGGAANCSSKYHGFYNQVMNAAWQFNYYKQNIRSYNYQPGRTNTIQYTTTASCGSKQVYIENVATASLYIYTPYTPNDAALAAYPGTASCGAYGNRNFFMFFNEWFGSTQSTAPTIVSPAPNNYYIVQKTNYEKSIQLSAANTANGIGIIASTRVENALDTFSFIKNPDNTYTIKNISTGKVLDVPLANAVEGAVLQQYDPNDTNAQKWHIYDNGDGSYSIASSIDKNLALTIAANGALKLSGYTKSAEQSFRLIPTEQYVADGVYTINSNLASDFVTDIYNGLTANSSKTWMYDKNNSSAQIFQFTYNSKTGYYTLLNPKSNRVLDVASAGTADGTGIIIYDSNNTCAQQWIIEKWSDDQFSILSACSSKALDVANGSSAAGAKLQIYTKNNTTAQKWHFEPTKIPTPPLADGLYAITSALKPNYVVDIASGGTKDNTNVWMYTQNNTAAQTFQLQYDTTYEAYAIINPQSGKALDVAGGGTNDGTNVQIYTSNGTCSQRWIITPLANEQYQLTSACSGKALDVYAAYTNDGTNVHIWEKNNTPAQKWTFVSLSQ